MLLLAYNPSNPDLDSTEYLEVKAGVDKDPTYLAAKENLPPGQTFMVYLMAKIHANNRTKVK